MAVHPTAQALPPFQAQVNLRKCNLCGMVLIPHAATNHQCQDQAPTFTTIQTTVLEALGLIPIQSVKGQPS